MLYNDITQAYIYLQIWKHHKFQYDGFRVKRAENAKYLLSTKKYRIFPTSQTGLIQLYSVRIAGQRKFHFSKNNGGRPIVPARTLAGFE